MNYEDLKSAAQRILAAEPTGEYSLVTFDTRSGELRNNAEIPEHHRSAEIAYRTVRNGAAFRTAVTILCRDTEMVDAKGRRIYQIPDGRVFVFAYQAGNEYYFDSGAIIVPLMAREAQSAGE